MWYTIFKKAYLWNQQDRRLLFVICNKSYTNSSTNSLKSRAWKRTMWIHAAWIHRSGSYDFTLHEFIRYEFMQINMTPSYDFIRYEFTMIYMKSYPPPCWDAPYENLTMEIGKMEHAEPGPSIVERSNRCRGTRTMDSYLVVRASIYRYTISSVSVVGRRPTSRP